MSAKQEASPAYLPWHIPGIMMVHLGGYGHSRRLVHWKEDFGIRGSWGHWSGTTGG